MSATTAAARKPAAPDAPQSDVATGPQIPIDGPVRLVWAVTPEGLHCQWVWTGNGSRKYYFE